MKPYPSRQLRWPLLLILLLFHGLVFVGLSRQRAEPVQQAKAVMLRILPPELPKPPAIPQARAPRNTAFVPSPVYVPVPEVATPANPSTVATVSTPPAAPASAASAPARLNLNLPTNMLAAPHAPTAREQALNDPRSNSIKISVEYNIADAAGTLPVTTSTSTDGMESTIIRQGRTRCRRISKPRGAVLDPMDSRLQGMPAMVGDCPHK